MDENCDVYLTITNKKTGESKTYKLKDIIANPDGSLDFILEDPETGEQKRLNMKIEEENGIPMVKTEGVVKDNSPLERLSNRAGSIEFNPAEKEIRITNSQPINLSPKFNNNGFTTVPRGGNELGITPKEPFFSATQKTKKSIKPPNLPVSDKNNIYVLVFLLIITLIGISLIGKYKKSNKSNEIK